MLRRILRRPLRLRVFCCTTFHQPSMHPRACDLFDMSFCLCNSVTGVAVKPSLRICWAPLNKLYSDALHSQSWLYQLRLPWCLQGSLQDASHP